MFQVSADQLPLQKDKFPLSVFLREVDLTLNAKFMGKRSVFPPREALGRRFYKVNFQLAGFAILAFLLLIYIKKIVVD